MRSLELDTDEVDLDLTLAPTAMLAADPTLRLGPGHLERATLTPQDQGASAQWSRPGHALDTTLRQVRGIGPWTTSCLASFTYRDPDTVITGDSGIPSMVSWVLAGERRALRAPGHQFRGH